MRPTPTSPSRNQRSIRLSLALYRALLVAYPAAFRHTYGAQMLQVFRDRCRQAIQERGPRGLMALWLPTLADLFTTALAERLATTRPLSRPFLSRLCGLLMLVSASLALLLGLDVLVRDLFGIHLYQLAPGLEPDTDAGFVHALHWYPVWGLLGLLLCQRTWLTRLGASLALLGQVLIVWNLPLYTWSFTVDVYAIASATLTTRLLGLVVLPLGLLLCGFAAWRVRLLGRWSVVVVLLALATGLHGFLILRVWVSLFAAPRQGIGFVAAVLLQILDSGVVLAPLWAGLGYALWAKQDTPVVGPPEPLTASSIQSQSAT